MPSKTKAPAEILFCVAKAFLIKGNEHKRIRKKGKGRD
jgi:hypothetical protein